MPPQLHPTSDADKNSFAVQLGAAPEHIATARHRLAYWLDNIAVKPPQVHDVLLAVGEAVANAVEHGSQLDPSKVVVVQASVRDETLTVTVSDPGRWTSPLDASANLSRHRGRGLFLINELADDVDIVHSGQGTHFTMQFDVSERSALRLTGTT